MNNGRDASAQRCTDSNVRSRTVPTNHANSEVSRLTMDLPTEQLFHNGSDWIHIEDPFGHYLPV